jgi:hypothetical protein
VGSRAGLENNTSWVEKRKMYDLAARHPPAQLISIVREPADTFFSKYE